MVQTTTIAVSVLQSLRNRYALGNSSDLERALRNPSLTAASFESSVRGGKGCELTAGRIMVERSPPELFAAIAKALGVSPSRGADEYLEIAERENVPIIVGWDTRGGGVQRCAKLYINASDVSRRTRSAICAELLSDRCFEEPPAVLGLNCRADGIEEKKAYLQQADAVALSQTVSESATRLARAAQRDGASSGGVLSLDVHSDSVVPRAFFVALREPPQATTWQCVEELPGYDTAEIDEILPFEPAAPRSIGISLVDDRWTAYFKPSGSSRAPESLEPLAIFASDLGEVGLFVEPTAGAERAFRRTQRHAISCRIRSGEPPPEHLENLVDWFCIRIDEAEPRNLADLEIDSPPSPWHLLSK